MDDHQSTYLKNLTPPTKKEKENPTSNPSQKRNEKKKEMNHI
jgi:hypothetical protein